MSHYPKGGVYRFACGHRKTRKNQNYRGGCQTCTNAQMAKARERSPIGKPAKPRRAAPKVRAEKVKLFEQIRPEAAATIRELARRKLSQRLIALEAGVSQATVSRFLSSSDFSNAPRFELVSVRTQPEVESGRSYQLAPRRTA